MIMKEINFDTAIKIMFIPWYLRILGFSTEIKIKIQKEPIQHSNYWSYPVETRYIYYKWLNFKIKTFKYVHDDE